MVSTSQRESSPYLFFEWERLFPPYYNAFSDKQHVLSFIGLQRNRTQLMEERTAEAKQTSLGPGTTSSQ